MMRKSKKEEKLKLVDKIIYTLLEVNEDEEFIHKDLWVSPLGDYSHPTDPDVAKGEQVEDEPVSTEEATSIVEDLVKDKVEAILEEDELDEEQEMRDNSSKGILVNKRHY